MIHYAKDSSVTSQVLTSITVSPPNASVNTGGMQVFTAVASDQAGNPMSPQPNFTWSVSGGGTINSTGLFTAGVFPGGPFTVTASSVSVSGTASVTVADAPPTVVIPAAAASPTFSVNGTNAAQNTQVTFKKAGFYVFTVTIQEPSGLTATSSVSVNVNQTISSVSVAPISATMAHGTTQLFTATAKDLFGINMSPQPTFTWNATGGTVTSGGLYTAGAATGSSFSVTATAGGKTGSAAVTIN